MRRAGSLVPLSSARANVYGPREFWDFFGKIWTKDGHRKPYLSYHDWKAVFDKAEETGMLHSTGTEDNLQPLYSMPLRALALTRRRVMAAYKAGLSAEQFDSQDTLQVMAADAKMRAFAANNRGN